MAEIERKTIITDGALKAPYELAEGLDQVVKKLKEIAKLAIKSGQTIGSSNTGARVKKETEGLTQAQKELLKLQNQIAAAQAKQDEAYIQEQKRLAAIKQELKEKIALGERDAKTVNAQNASLKVLEAALAKNIRAYSLLKNEQERNSEAGQKLLKIIQLQDAQSKHLSATLGDNKKKVGDYTGGILAAWREIEKLKKETAELVVQQSKLTNSTEKERLEFNRLAVAIQQNNIQINQYQQTINNATMGVKAWISQLFGAVGLIGGIYGVVLALKSFITVNKELEKSLSDLEALTGASTEDLRFYKSEAIAIGSETKRSAKDVVEAFKLIGGARPELLKDKEALAAVTREAIILANASNMELKDAADAVGGALNQLQLKATDAGRAINVYAAGAKEGAAEIPQINAAFQQFGAVLQQNNGSIEEGVALIEVLGDRQIKGAEAGTALRNVLLALSAVDVLPKSAKQQMARFGVDLEIVGNTALPLNQRLRELGKIAGDSSALVKVFGKENFVAGNIILNNIERFDQLTKAVTGTNEAYRQAEVATNNLTGDLAEAGSETEAFAVQIGESTQSMLRKLVQGYTFFIRLLREAPAIVKENQASLASLGVAVLALNTRQIALTASTLKSIVVDRLKIISVNSLRAATLRLYTTLAANPFGLILLAIAGVIAAIRTYDAFSQRSATIARETTDINKELDQSIKQVAESREQLNVSVDEYLKKSPEEQKKLREEVLLRKQQALEIYGVMEARILDLKSAAKELTLWQQTKVALIGATKAYSLAGLAAAEYAAENEKAIDDKFADKLAKLKEEIAQYENFLKDSTKVDEESTAAATKAEKDASFELRKFRLQQAILAQEEIRDNEAKFFGERYTAEQKAIELRKKLAAVERDDKLDNEKLTASGRLLINEEYQAKLKEIEKDGVETHKELSKEKMEADRKYAETLLQSSIRSNENIMKFEGATLEQRNRAALDIAADKQALLDLQYQREQEAAKGNADQLLIIQKEYQLKSEQIAKELAESTGGNVFAVFSQISGNIGGEADQRLKALNEAFTAGKISLKQYEKERREIIEQANRDILKAELEFLKKQLELSNVDGNSRLEIQRKIAALEVAIAEESADKQIDAQKRINEAVLDLRNSLLDNSVAISGNFTAAENQRIDNRIAALQREQEVQLKMAGDNEAAKDQIRERFAAKEKKLEEEKRRNQRKQAVFEKALAVSKIIIDTQQAISRQFVDLPYFAALPISILLGAMGALSIATVLSAPLPSYFKGTDDHPGGLARVGEKGFELVTTPRGEMFFTPNQETVMELPKHSKVTTHEDTLRWLALQGVLGTEYRGGSQDGYFGRAALQALQDINRSIKSNRPVQVDVVQSGAALYQAKKEGEKFTKLIRSVALGYWAE